jgi:phage-related protein
MPVDCALSRIFASWNRMAAQTGDAASGGMSLCSCRQFSRRYHIWYNRLAAWTVETLNETVDAELAELPADMRARMIRISELIESVGLTNVKEPHVRHVRGHLWEMRLKGKAGIARALYVTAKEQRVVIVRAFIKKTEKTPAGEIVLALERAKEVKP